jgi:hypothetical protein
MIKSAMEKERIFAEIRSCKRLGLKAFPGGIF